MLQSDVAFIANDRRAILTERAIEGAPTLVVEILSPPTRRADRTIKAGLSARYAVPWYWIVDPGARTIEALTLRSGTYEPVGLLQRSQRGALPPLHGLTLDLEQLFGI